MNKEITKCNTCESGSQVYFKQNRLGIVPRIDDVMFNTTYVVRTQIRVL